MEKEKFSTRLGFILISAGCAIGIGNVYKFPIWTGAYGGGIFVLFYLIFLVILGLPAMVCEFAVGRASHKSIASSFKALEPAGSKWHIWQYVGIAANYALMFCYTPIAGWFIIYFYKYLTGAAYAAGTTQDELMTFFVDSCAANPSSSLIAAYIAIVIGLGVCAIGLKKGVEKITKVMMVLLFVLLTCLAIYSCTLSGLGEALKFYLVPSVEKAEAVGWGTVISSAMAQAFFTLSIGIGSMAIFGASIGKEKRLMGESITIIVLDTFVAITSGLFLFPAYFTFNPGSTINGSDAGAIFLFKTISSVFNNMAGGRLLGTLFFLFMCFASLSTVIAVMENIVNFWLEKTRLKRGIVCLINIGIMFVAVIASVNGNTGNGFFGAFTIFGKTVGDFEDWLVSNLALPIGSLVYVGFCTWKYGWGWNNFLSEANAGVGKKFPAWARVYMSYILPIIIGVVFIMSII